MKRTIPPTCNVLIPCQERAIQGFERTYPAPTTDDPHGVAVGGKPYWWCEEHAKIARARVGSQKGRYLSPDQL